MTDTTDYIFTLTAAQRAANGARWLDENFAGWRSRIDPTTLILNNGEQCICGQVFGEAAKSESFTQMGYTYAYDHLFAEANAWITGSIPKTEPNRAMRVSQYLGFMDGAFFGEGDSTWVTFRDLQHAWEDILGVPHTPMNEDGDEIYTDELSGDFN